MFRILTIQNFSMVTQMSCMNFDFFTLTYDCVFWHTFLLVTITNSVLA